MSGQSKMAHDPKNWVRSPGKKWYWRHPTESSWRGPPNDRVWVPSIDAPDDLDPPPDDEDDGDVAMAPPPAIFGTLPTVAPNPAVTTTSNPPAQPPPQAPIVPQRAATAPGPTQRTSAQHPRDNNYNGFTGPFASTMRYMDEGRARQMAQSARAPAPAPGQAHRAPQGPPPQQWRPQYIDGPRYDDRHQPPHQYPEPRDDQRWYDPAREQRDGGQRRHESPRAPRTDVRREGPRSLGGDDRREEQRAEAHAHQERAREQALRARAASTRPPPAPPRQIQPPPDVTIAARDENGQPILPSVAVDDDVSDYGGSSDEDEEDELRNLKKFRTREDMRLQENASRGTAPPVPMMPPPLEAGLWAELSFATVVAARNLTRWMTGGCPRARAMYMYLMRYYGANPGARRSDGIQYLMRDQQRAEAGWLLATTGDSTPLSRRGDRRGPSRNQRRRAKARQAPRIGSSGTTSASTKSVADEDDPMAPAPPALPHRQSYAGRAPLPTTPVEGRLGPELSLDDVVRDMVGRPPKSWAQAVRLENGDWASPETPAGARPLEADVLASRFFQFIAPVRGAVTSIDRARFMELVLVGLSLPGLFERLVMRGGWVYSAMALEHFPFDAANLTMSQALAWVYQHGIMPATPELRMLQGYATAWRNMRDASPDPTALEFRAAPRNIFDVLSWPDSQITSWRDLHYGPVRQGIVTTSSRFPAGGLAASIHAPAPPPAITPATDEEMPTAAPDETESAPTPVTDEREDGEVIPRADEAPPEVIPPTTPTTSAANIALPTSPAASDYGDNDGVTPEADPNAAPA
ncbi:hypothetical protein B0H15DRAFT_947818 [Mycena belliarum]|uniref:Uncharacterized protein n=1 Tax=Mycena belliarum TaxID=1033014 RepID=A0AAD6XSZ2_9AGAR|nr:hypothetical protein B0H15DRAFT_947818 [Mycena belliae]